MPTYEEAMLLKHEEEVLHAYYDSEGYLTIGVGHLIDKRKGGGITKDQSRRILADDIAKFKAELAQRLPWVVSLDPARQLVFLDLAFNMGLGQPGTSGLLSFTNTLEAARKAQWDKVARGLESSLWARQVGPSRVEDNKNMILYGVIPESLK